MTTKLAKEQINSMTDAVNVRDYGAVGDGFPNNVVSLDTIQYRAG